MNAKSCLLCGKPLSRLRVGGDGDFCSREHRNQHRLRRGMDRLEEANKVTSLMRRRENPRHISPARLMCNSALEQRGFLEPKPLAAGTEMIMPGDNVDGMNVELISTIAMEEGLRFAIREGGRTVGAGVVTKIVE